MQVCPQSTLFRPPPWVLRHQPRSLSLALDRPRPLSTPSVSLKLPRSDITSPHPGQSSLSRHCSGSTRPARPPRRRPLEARPPDRSHNATGPRHPPGPVHLNQPPPHPSAATPRPASSSHPACHRSSHLRKRRPFAGPLSPGSRWPRATYCCFQTLMRPPRRVPPASLRCHCQRSSQPPLAPGDGLVDWSEAVGGRRRSAGRACWHGSGASRCGCGRDCGAAPSWLSGRDSLGRSCPSDRPVTRGSSSGPAGVIPGDVRRRLRDCGTLEGRRASRSPLDTNVRTYVFTHSVLHALGFVEMCGQREMPKSNTQRHAFRSQG